MAYTHNKRYTFDNLVFLIKNTAPFWFDCPHCVSLKERDKDPYNSSVVIRHLWDEKYHKYKFYGHCRNINCKYVTPAFDTAREAISHIDINWALKEDEILLGDSK